MSKWSDRFDLDEWREEIAVAVGNGDDILEAAGRDWDEAVEYEPPQPAVGQDRKEPSP